MRNREGRRRLAAEIVEFLLVSLAVAAFTYLFLYYTSGSLAETYLGETGPYFSCCFCSWWDRGWPIC